MNGRVTLFEQELPITAALSTDNGVLSFNLDAVTGPIVPGDNFASLAPLIPSSILGRNWNEVASTFFASFKTYRLTSLNLIYDVAKSAPVSLGIGITFGENLESLTYALGAGRVLTVSMKDVSVSWLTHLPAAEASVSYGEVEAFVDFFGNVPWTCSFGSWPEFAITCTADEDVLSEQLAASFVAWLQREPPKVGAYAGCSFNFKPEGFEFFVMDYTGEARQVV